MRDLTHDDFITRWAERVKTDPKWKEYHTKFINAQYEKSINFIEEMCKTKEGQKKIAELYKIKNLKGYPKLFKDII